MLSLADGSDLDRHQASSRRFRSIIAEEIVDAVAAEHDVEPSDYAVFRSQAPGRDRGIVKSRVLE